MPCDAALTACILLLAQVDPLTHCWIQPNNHRKVNQVSASQFGVVIRMQDKNHRNKCLVRHSDMMITGRS